MVALYITAKRKCGTTALFEPTHFRNSPTEHPLQYSIQIVKMGHKIALLKFTLLSSQ